MGYGRTCELGFLQVTTFKGCYKVVPKDGSIWTVGEAFFGDSPFDETIKTECSYLSVEKH